MEKQIELALENSRYNILRLNQYSKGFYIKCNLINYEYKSGDVATIEFMINGVAIIQSTDVAIDGDIVVFKLLREVTLNSGKGYFNVVISNSNDNSRTSNFKADVEIIGNSIDENTVSSTFIVTAKEELDTTIIEADTKITELNTLIESTTVTELNGKVDKVDGKGLSANDFTNDYKTKIDTNSSNIATLQTEVNSINGSNVGTPITFDLVCGTSEATKHNNSAHNWYIVRNGFCYVQLDLDVVNKDIQALKIIKHLPQPMFSAKEFWDNIVGQGNNVGNSLSFKITTDTDTSTGTITVDKASSAGRYMGTIIYPILT